jgi:hypothetical protein
MLRTHDETIDLNAITAVYLRPYDWRRLPEIEKAGSRNSAWRHALEVEDVLAAWLEITPALVVNRLTAMAATNSKPDQAFHIRACGFEAPETLDTIKVYDVPSPNDNSARGERCLCQGMTR